MKKPFFRVKLISRESHFPSWLVIGREYTVIGIVINVGPLTAYMLEEDEFKCFSSVHFEPVPDEGMNEAI